MLILFDIDATLITTGGVGVRAMGDAGRELYGESFTEHRVEYAGRLDPLIIEDLLRDNGQAPTPANARAMREGYRRHLARRLVDAPARPLPGVTELLAALRLRSECTLGLLTGNFAETGSMKLRACGLDPEWFTIAVWGDHSPHAPPRREHLSGVGLSRYRERHGRVPGRAVIVGDTPHDVSCALAGGCECLGVATGRFGLEELRRAGAHRTEADLSNTGAILAWLGMNEGGKSNGTSNAT